MKGVRSALSAGSAYIGTWWSKMTDLTLEDLANPVSSSESSDGEAESESGESTAEWVDKLFDKLDEKGVVDAYIESQLGLNDIDMSNSDKPSIEGDSDGESGGIDLGAGDIAHFGKLVIDNVGDVSMSTVVQYAESNPEMVDKLIQKATQDQ